MAREVQRTTRRDCVYWLAREGDIEMERGEGGGEWEMESIY